MGRPALPSPSSTTLLRSSSIPRAYSCLVSVSSLWPFRCRRTRFFLLAISSYCRSERSVVLENVPYYFTLLSELFVVNLSSGTFNSHGWISLQLLAASWIFMYHVSLASDGSYFYLLQIVQFSTVGDIVFRLNPDPGVKNLKITQKKCKEMSNNCNFIKNA